MTEQEAIKALRFEGGLEITGKLSRAIEFFKGMEVAEAALEEIQQYHAVGTVQECKEAREKQAPKKIVPDGAFGKCPCCGEPFNSELISEYEMRFCLWCGQRLEI